VSFLRPDIEKLATRRNVSGLIRALGHSDSSIQYGAVDALTTIGTQAIPELLRALRSSNREVRKGGAVVLGWIGDPGTVGPLLALLHADSDLHVLGGVIFALGRLRDPQAVNSLCGLLRHSDPVVRRQAASALGRIGDAHAVRPLCAAVFDTSVFVTANYTHWTVDHVRKARESMIEALESLGKPAVGPLIELTGCGLPEAREIAVHLVERIEAAHQASL
jgi:HEAT repeat protein